MNSNTTAECIICNDPARDTIRGFCGHRFCIQCIGDTDECPVCSIEMKCVICYEPFQQNNCSITPCGHRFCFKCITTHIMSAKRECPMCRAKLVEDDVYHRYMSSEEEDYDESDEDNDDDGETEEHDSDRGGDGDTEIATEDDEDSLPPPLDIERLANKVMAHSYTYRDLVEIISEFSGYYLGGRMREIHHMYHEFLEIIDDTISETCDEMTGFANEDVNVLKFPTEAAAAAAVAEAATQT